MMKNLFLLLVCLICGSCLFAQADSTQQLPPYKRFPSLPPVQLLLSDSSTLFTKSQIAAGRRVLFMVFSPDCEHCQHETEELIAHRNELKDVQIVMVTMYPLWKMKEFVSRYGLDAYSNIVIGKDIYYTLPAFYDIRNLPYLALYNKKGLLTATFEGAWPLTKIIETMKQN